VGEEARVYDCIKGHRFSSKGYCVWPPAEDHLATRRELRD
jgi:hypothetical protein